MISSKRLAELLASPRVNLGGPTVDSCWGLAELILKYFPERGRIVETGTYDGVSTELMAILRPNAHIISVDLFPRPLAKLRLRNYPNVTLVHGEATAFALLQPERSVAAAYLDNDHSYPFVSRELRAWLPAIVEGGLLSGHDYEFDPGTKQAVDEVLGLDVIHFSDTSWAKVMI